MEDEVEGETGDTISVGNHDFVDFSAHNGVQKGEELGALPVDTRSDFFDDGMVRVCFLEGRGLAFEVLRLLGAGDASVADFLEWDLSGRESAGTIIDSKCFGDIVGVIDAFATFRESEGAHFITICPVDKGGV